MKAAAPTRRTTAALIAALVLLAGCSDQELYSQLSERQANEMVAVLRSVGIDAEKRSQEGRFSVHTAVSEFPRAVRELSAQGLPREQFDTMGSVFKREGFVSSPLEERARLVHALSQEISSTVASIDGVVSARVHLVVPERNPLADKAQPAAASVFIKHRPEKDFSSQVAQIKALVVNSIEGLPYDNVTVALFPAEPLPIPAAPAAGPLGPAGTLPDAKLIAGGAGGGVLLIGGAWLMLRRKPSAQASAPDRAATALDDDSTRPPARVLAGAMPGAAGALHAGAQAPRPRSREELQAVLRRAAAGPQK
ncbi:MAG TPA: type III secretion inner membrane ring lipoprotein SctJ [Albitalea sp.]